MKLSEFLNEYDYLADMKHANDGSLLRYEIFLNPTNDELPTESFDNRAIITPNGNMYMAGNVIDSDDVVFNDLYNLATHYDLWKYLRKTKILKSFYSNDDTKSCIQVQRIGQSNILTYGESNNPFIKKNFKKLIKPYLLKFGKKNPNWRFK